MVRESRKHRSLALRAAREASRVLPFFEQDRPKDERPRLAIEALRLWAQGKVELGMAPVRQLAQGAHAAARAAKTDVAKFAARAAGQAIAVWHVPNHVLGVKYYVKKVSVANKKSGLKTRN